MSVFTQFHGNSSQICWDVSLKTANVLVKLEEKSRAGVSNSITKGAMLKKSQPIFGPNRAYIYWTHSIQSSQSF